MTFTRHRTSNHDQPSEGRQWLCRNIRVSARNAQSRFCKTSSPDENNSIALGSAGIATTGERTNSTYRRIRQVRTSGNAKRVAQHFMGDRVGRAEVIRIHHSFARTHAEIGIDPNGSGHHSVNSVFVPNVLEQSGKVGSIASHVGTRYHPGRSGPLSADAEIPTRLSKVNDIAMPVLAFVSLRLKDAHVRSSVRRLRVGHTRQHIKLGDDHVSRSCHVRLVDPIEIFDRDEWCCKVCGIETPQHKRGTYDADAPELDHIVPLVRGGPHTRANLQCACRSCNLIKGGE